MTHKSTPAPDTQTETPRDCKHGQLARSCELCWYERELAQAQLENMCDACAGTGTPVSNKACMCGGTGRMSDAARYLREQLAQARAELRAAQRDAERYRWLRSAGWFDDAIMERERMNELFSETIDRAIDAASAGRGET